MKILIFEYVCGGGFQGALPPSGLLQQGREMLQATLADFARLPDSVQVYTLIEEKFAFAMPGEVQCRHPGVFWHDAWLDLVRYCDAVLVIAPESENQLENLCREVLEEGRASLNCSIGAIRLTADKWALNRHLRTSGVAAVATDVWDPSWPLPDHGVIKPRYGAGCEDTFMLGADQRVPTLSPDGPWVWQPWVSGQAASLSLLADKSTVEILSCNRIHCHERGGRLHVRDIDTRGFDGDAQFQEAARGMACRLMEAVPGLLGYVGVDVVWREGSLIVLEINPRLTLTYVGLLVPLAERMLQAFDCTGEPA